MDFLDLKMTAGLYITLTVQVFDPADVALATLAESTPYQAGEFL